METVFYHVQSEYVAWERISTQTLIRILAESLSGILFPPAPIIRRILHTTSPPRDLQPCNAIQGSALGTEQLRCTSYCHRLRPHSTVPLLCLIRVTPHAVNEHSSQVIVQRKMKYSSKNGVEVLAISSSLCPTALVSMDQRDFSVSSGLPLLVVIWFGVKGTPIAPRKY